VLGFGLQSGLVIRVRDGGLGLVFSVRVGLGFGLGLGLVLGLGLWLGL